MGCCGVILQEYLGTVTSVTTRHVVEPEQEVPALASDSGNFDSGDSDYNEEGP